LKIPRDVNGAVLASRLTGLGFEQVRQTGSHIQVKHTKSGETTSIPAHQSLKVGTLAAILRDVQELTGYTRDELLAKLT
jgi:predicted RNA binding protein YcfA (HicA-like mRNA interferase family)